MDRPSPGGPEKLSGSAHEEHPETQPIPEEQPQEEISQETQEVPTPAATPEMVIEPSGVEEEKEIPPPTKEEVREEVGSSDLENRPIYTMDEADRLQREINASSQET